MDPFAVGVFVVVALAVGGAILAARASRSRPAREFGNREAGHRPELAVSPSALEHQDLQEMLAATNAHRRSRGLPERSIADAIREFED